ncbi:hypothetical protein C8Q78DRAFT_1028292 [Trametes maxima]|nr:hypothetical protein C8Q78DRAFT_1028292 [Trametes maxima]
MAWVSALASSSISSSLCYPYFLVPMSSDDHAGSGLSPPTEYGVSLSYMLADLDALLAAEVPTGQTVFIAHSAGTILAFWWLLTGSSLLCRQAYRHARTPRVVRTMRAYGGYPGGGRSASQHRHLALPFPRKDVYGSAPSRRRSHQRYYGFAERRVIRCVNPCVRQGSVPRRR